MKDFRRKAEIFNAFFMKQCSLRNTCSDLPQPLSTIHFTSDDSRKIIKKIYPNKAHGHDMTSIWMVKICDASL